MLSAMAWAAPISISCTITRAPASARPGAMAGPLRRPRPRLVQLAEECLRPGDALLDFFLAGQRVAAAGYQGERLEVAQLLQRLGPVLEVGVAGIGRGAIFDQVAAEQRALLGQPDDRVALGMAAADMDDVDLQLA